ncbi:unnamed protein product [Tetraodon nigroviridis]|uniref:Chromosome 7 SCAF14650, whole genome shotgun sequence n=1 Tax=Tetraodon nigroviridis TaxID=99883 RepID=Q4SCR4_TETNG|nr:unnamed protein product [Tetraodon nigroviridis]
MLPCEMVERVFPITSNLSKEIIRPDVMVPAKQTLIWTLQVCEEPE